MFPQNGSGLLKIATAFGRKLGWFVYPTYLVTDISARRQAIFSAMMSLSLFLVVLIGFVANIFVYGLNHFITIVLAGLSVILFLAYVLSRLSAFRFLGPALLTFSLSASAFLVALFHPDRETLYISGAIFTFIPLALVIGSALITWRGNFALMAAIIASVLLLPLVIPTYPLERAGADAGAILSAGVLLLGVNAYRNGTERLRLKEIQGINQQLKRVNRELEAKNAELERFTYTVSHDLKSPLITIRGFLGFIEQDTQSGNMNRLKGDIQRISDATDKMQRLLNELLEISRVGRVRNEPKLIPFEELALEAVELVQGRIMKRGIEVHIDSNMPTVFGDNQRLLEVLQNLVDNAAKFMGDQPDPRIEIGARSARGENAERGEPVFYVKDNGIGIAPEHHERVFGLFNQLDPKIEGTGVGLTLVKRIVEFHGGRVWVESEAGKGATFCFTLPVPQTDKPI